MYKRKLGQETCVNQLCVLLSPFCHGIFQLQTIYFNDDIYQGQATHTE